jgi:hypothetical protein
MRKVNDILQEIVQKNLFELGYIDKITYVPPINCQQIIYETVMQDLKKAGFNVDKSPTEAQIKAGNYRKGHVTVMGFKISIENPKGSYRKGKDKSGKEWKTLMHNTYGYFLNSEGYDGDHVDVFLNDDNFNEEGEIYGIDQFINGKFDETKFMMGFDSTEQAKKAYLSNYEKDWKGFKYITSTTVPKFKEWLYDNKKQRKPFHDYVDIKRNIKKSLVNESIILIKES